MAALGIQTTDAAAICCRWAASSARSQKRRRTWGSPASRVLETLRGRQGISAMSALLAVGADRLEDYTDTLRASGGVAAEVAERQMDNGGAMTEMRSAIEGAQIAIGNAFIPVLRVGRGRLREWSPHSTTAGAIQTTIAVGMGVVGVVSSLALAASFIIPQIGRP